MTTTTVIVLVLSFIVLGMCSNILSFSLPVQINSTASTITPAQKSCSCTRGDKSDRCIMDEVFASIQFFEEGYHAYVYQNVTATVRPVLTGTTMRSIFNFELFYGKCWLKTNGSSNAYVAFHATSQCSSFRCCVQCTGCPHNRILNDKGPPILKEEMNICDFKTGEFTLLLQCGMNGSHSVAGAHFFMLRLSKFYDVCTAAESVSNDTPVTIPGITVSHKTFTTSVPNTMVFTPAISSKRPTLSLLSDIKDSKSGSATTKLNAESPLISLVTEGTNHTLSMHILIATSNSLTNTSLMIVGAPNTDIKLKDFSDAYLMLPVVLTVAGAVLLVIVCVSLNCLLCRWYNARTVVPQ